MAVRSVSGQALARPIFPEKAIETCSRTGAFLPAYPSKVGPYRLSHRGDLESRIERDPFLPPRVSKQAVTSTQSTSHDFAISPTRFRVCKVDTPDMDSALPEQFEGFAAGSSDDQETKTGEPLKLRAEQTYRRIAPGYDQSLIRLDARPKVHALSREDSVVRGGADERGIRRVQHRAAQDIRTEESARDSIGRPGPHGLVLRALELKEILHLALEHLRKRKRDFRRGHMSSSLDRANCRSRSPGAIRKLRLGPPS